MLPDRVNVCGAAAVGVCAFAAPAIDIVRAAAAERVARFIRRITIASCEVSR
jgi:hypothetical protein